MRIAYLTNFYPSPTHTFIRREIAAVERQGLEILRVSIRAPGVDLPEEADRAEYAKTIVILRRPARVILDAAAVAVTRPLRFVRTALLALRLGWRSYAGLLRHAAYFAESCAFLRLLVRDKIDHVHAHFGTNPTMVAMLCRSLGGPPYSFMIHGPGEFDSPELLHVPEKVERSAFVTAITEFARSQTCRWSNIDQWHKIDVVRCAVDDRYLRAPLTPVPDRPALVFVGRMGRSKGHAVLIEAVDRLVREGESLKIKLIGDGPLRTFLENRIRERGLEEIFEFAGWVDEATVREAIVSSRALVLPSFGEGLPVVIMEAFALGRPVISTRIAGIPELLVDGVNGWLVTSGSVAELADAIREVLRSPVDRLLKMGLEGRRIVQEKHDASKEAEKLVKLFGRSEDLQNRGSRRVVKQAHPWSTSA